MVHDAVRKYIRSRTARADVAHETAWVVEQYRGALERLGAL